MTRPSTCLLDETRALYPHLGLAVYAFEPGGAVTLEIHTPGGDLFTSRASTLAGAIAKAFPPEPLDNPEPPAVPVDVFG